MGSTLLRAVCLKVFNSAMLFIFDKVKKANVIRWSHKLSFVQEVWGKNIYDINAYIHKIKTEMFTIRVTDWYGNQGLIWRSVKVVSVNFSEF